MKGHISLTGNYEQFVTGDVRTPGKSLTKSVIILYQKKKHTIRCVEFGLLICSINAQLHSPLLGYCLLKEWDKLVWEDRVTLIFPKINETWWLFEWTAFTKHFSLENFTSYVWFGMYTNKHLNSFWYCLLFECDPCHYIFSEQHIKNIIFGQLPLSFSLRYGSNSPKASKQP